MLLSVLPSPARLPMTRLSATEELFGWRKLTASLDEIEKPCQLMTVDCDDWLMLVVVPLCEMLAEPATTCPPFGSANAGCSSTIRAATAPKLATPMTTRPTETTSAEAHTRRDSEPADDSTWRRSESEWRCIMTPVLYLTVLRASAE